MTVDHHPPDLQKIPRWPRVQAEVRSDGTAHVTVNGAIHKFEADTEEHARQAVIGFIAEHTARQLNRGVYVSTTGSSGDFELVIYPDKKVVAVDGAPSKQTPARAKTAAEVENSDGNDVDDQELHHAAAVPAVPATRTPAASLPTVADLIAARPSAGSAPARRGWQGAVRRMTGGMVSPTPGPGEAAYRRDVGAIQRGWTGPRTIVVVNPKGGAHKTTATLLLAATFGTHRGGYTLAWDNNETRGTLGWRALPARHSLTAVDLLHDLGRFTDAHAGAARVGDLDRYVRPQPARFDVLASDEDAASAASIDAEAFTRLHGTLARFYRLLIIDTGNNMRASNWRAAIDVADQLVIVSTVRADTAQSAAWLVDALRAGDHPALRNAVTVLTSPTRQPNPELRKRLHHHFGQLTRSVLDVPYDQALVSGGPISYDSLAPVTRDAWLRVAAVISEQL